MIYICTSNGDFMGRTWGYINHHGDGKHTLRQSKMTGTSSNYSWGITGGHEKDPTRSNKNIMIHELNQN
jgi:hypothetical protein